MATNRNEELTARSQASPARYNRCFARSQWRSQFGSRSAWRHGRQKDRDYSFRGFAGSTAGPVEAVAV